MFKKFTGMLMLAGTVVAITACTTTDAGGGSDNTPAAKNAIGVSHSLVLARDDRELVQLADVIVHGEPVGAIETLPPTSVGGFTEYYQDVRILSVVKGETFEQTLRVLRVGIDRAALGQFEKAKGVAVFIEDAEHFPGPLSQGPQILFLHRKTPSGVFPVVGFRQGAFLLGPDGRVAEAHEFKSFEGLTVPEVKQRIEELSRR